MGRGAERRHCIPHRAERPNVNDQLALRRSILVSFQPVID